MKYYAVTDDPTELIHYGVKGMKWGQHIFVKERSAGFRRASSKLSKNMRHGIRSKIAHWKKSPSPAVLRAKAKVKAAKQEAKAFKKEQKFMAKAIQKAREGKLKYGKLTDSQVQRVTERLQLEQRARQLGSTEKPKFRTRMKDAVQEGMLRGATAGTSAYIEEQWRAKGKVKANQKYGKKLAKVNAREKMYENKYSDKYNAKRFAKKQRQEEHREEKRAEQLAREAYEYGAVFDSKGKLNYSNTKALGDYYNRKYIQGKSTSQTNKAEKKQQAKLYSAERRNTNKKKRIYQKTVRRIETAQRNAQQAEKNRAKKIVRAQSQASYQIMRVNPQSRKGVNRPYVISRKRSVGGNPLKG